MEEPYTDETPMPFGKLHYGKPLEDVPARYFLWLRTQPAIQKPQYKLLADYIEDNLDVLQKQEKEEGRFQ